MACHQPHHRLPRSWRVTRLYVVVDQARVARWGVRSFPQILEEHRHEHRADGQANQRQPVGRPACRVLHGA